MPRCEVCGNTYDKTFTIADAEGAEHVFDSFECAIHALAPTCPAAATVPRRWGSKVCETASRRDMREGGRHRRPPSPRLG
jgi:hypothetical protein